MVRILPSKEVSTKPGAIQLPPPNPLVLFWRWRYELILGIGLPAVLIVPGGISVMLGTLAGITVLGCTALLYAPTRRYLVARAWCIITPHRVRVGCAQAWIHSRRGKIPVVLLTTRQPFGERVHIRCRAGTSAIDFASALPLLTAACWARDIRVSGNERFAQLMTADVIRRLPPGQLPPDDLQPSHPTVHVPVPRTPPDDTDGPRTEPNPPSRQDFGPPAHFRRLFRTPREHTARRRPRVGQRASAWFCRPGTACQLRPLAQRHRRFPPLTRE